MVRTRTLSRGGCGSSLTDVIVSTGLVLCAPRPTDGSAEACARWRAKRDAPVRTNAEAIERMLLQEVGRCEQLSDQERVALADRLADVAMHHQWRATEFARAARKVRTGEH